MVQSHAKGLQHTGSSQETMHTLFFYQKHWKETYLLVQLHSSKHKESFRGMKALSFYQEIMPANSKGQIPTPVSDKAFLTVLQVFSCTTFIVAEGQHLHLKNFNRLANLGTHLKSTEEMNNFICNLSRTSISLSYSCVFGLIVLLVYLVYKLPPIETQKATLDMACPHRERTALMLDIHFV